MTIEVQKTVEHGVEYRTEVTPAGMVDVTSYSPASCPWDCYGRQDQNTTLWVLKAAGIEGVALTTHQRKLHPMGTGPRGMVRFGDDMLPGLYRVAVKADEAGAARVALVEHRASVDRWLFENGPMPEAIRG